MNYRSKHAARFALTGVALAACLWGTQASALGLGRLVVTSALGETLKAEIEITSMTADEASSLRLRVASPEAYRAAGVEYNAVLPSAQLQVVRRPDGRSFLRVSSDRAVLEPFIDVIVEATWSSGRLVREYTMLFDPPGSRTAQAPAPVLVPAPAAAPSIAAAPPARAQPALVQAARAPRAEVAETMRPQQAASPVPAAAFSGDEYRVRSGDSLSRIAGRTQRAGVSLDQMLVSLFRGNPQAFIGENMNRLKAGAMLTVPSVEQAGQLSQPEARAVIAAQSNDFSAYRQRLASGATMPADTAPARQASGKVQTQVDDSKLAAAPTPDRLTLSQGGVKASAPEVGSSRAAERKDANARLAELARNVDDLKKLQGTAAPTAQTAPAAPAPAAATAASPAAAPPAPSPAPAPTVIAAAPPAPLPAPAVPPATAPGTAATAAATAAATTSAATSATPSAAPSAATPSTSSPAAVVAAAPVMPAPVAAPAVATPPAATPAAPAATGEPGAVESLLDNALLLPGAAVLIAVLLGWGLYRLRSRRKPAGETSFLESRLQPDSFFGASGGQRIDTREPSVAASGNSSSMSYSLSQLDAIGDVDPVAEADVYLAYGRDLQAEEILKEAMRSVPERMAIRTKLLEVYAKRRDTKAYELLASQLFNLTHGEGEDWARAQELGLTIDPDNFLYQPGGRPEEVRLPSGQVVAEPLGASTMPYTSSAPPAFKPAADATLDNAALDLDLELDLPARAAPLPASDATQPHGARAARSDSTLDQRFSSPSEQTLDLSLEGDADETLPLRRPATAPEAPSRGMPGMAPSAKAQPSRSDDMTLDFDLLSLDEGTTTVSLPRSAQTAEPADDFGAFDLGSETVPAAAQGINEPLTRKLDLAEEFRQIGDLEGARDLLEEVLAKSEGALHAKAQGMLDKLG